MRLYNIKYLSPVIFISDMLILNAALWISYNAKVWPPHFKDPKLYTLVALIVNFSWLVTAQLLKNYKLQKPLRIKSALANVLACSIMQFIIALTAFYLLKMAGSLAMVTALYTLIFLTVLTVNRTVLLWTIKILKDKRKTTRRIGIIAYQDDIAPAISLFNNHLDEYAQIVHFISKEDADQLGTRDLVQLLKSKQVNELFVSFKITDNQYLDKLITECGLKSIRVKLYTDTLSSYDNVNLVNFNGLPLIDVNTLEKSKDEIRFFKRSFDILFSVIVMTVGLPIFILLVIITKLTSKGPVFYKQQRIGRHEKPFHIYKFRSMYIDAEKAGPQLANDYDPRVTRWGRVMRKTRLDELPQFWNVFKGDMSVVGPRPERQYFIEQIVQQNPDYLKLLHVKPGITSIGQVNYGYAENVEQMCNRLQHDLQYVRKMTLNKDLKIILDTVKVMIQAKGK